jgi:histidinol-phosphatase (PHP family)
MLWDNHMHSNFSGDCEADPVDMINSAKKKNLRGITFTDHLDLDFPKEFGDFNLDTEHYYPAQHKIAMEHSTSDFTVLTGIEVGIQPQVAEESKNIVNAHPYDFVIGSTHLIDGCDPFFWEKDDPVKLNRYYECILENISAFTDFDSLGHIDFAFRYLKSTELKNDSHMPYFEIVDEILNKIIKMDKALEINTAGIRKGMKYPNPTKSIIERYHELGGKLITLGADAHFPKDVAADFHVLPDLLADCGFKEFVVYEKRKPTLYPIG